MSTTTRPSAPTVSDRLVDYVVTLRYEDIPPDVVEKAKHHLAHLLGTAFRGRGLAGSRQAVELAAELTGVGGTCSIIGEPRRADLLEAVFANSFLISRIGHDDFILPQGAHPGIVVQPVAWSFGETARASGRDLLTAIVIGYDVLSRLCDPALTWGREEFRPATFVLEPFAAAATAARILQLDHEQTMCAFGHARHVGRHRTEIGDSQWTIHPLLARSSGMAALLANAGVPASPSVFEGEGGVFQTFFSQDMPATVEASLATLGHEFAITRARTKAGVWWAKTGVPSGSDVDPAGDIPRHPAVIPVELTRRLMSEHALSGDRVAAVEVVLAEERRVRETQRNEGLLRPDADTTTRQASPSLRIAMMIADGRIDPDLFERPPTPDLLAVLDKIQLRFEPGRPLLYTRIELTTDDGHEYVVVDDGNNDVPPKVDSIDWLTENAQAVLSERQLARLVELIDHLEDVRDVSDVMTCVVPETSS